MKVNMTPNPLDVVTIHASQGDTEARQWEFELHNNGELIDTSDVKEQLVFKAYKGGTEQLLPENTSTPTTSPFNGDIRYPQGLLADQEFTYRQSPTEEDGYAKIETIYGNTLVWNQIQPNTISRTHAGVTYTYDNGKLTVSGTATSTSWWLYGGLPVMNMKANHKYLFVFGEGMADSSINTFHWYLPNSNHRFYTDGIITINSDTEQYVQLQVSAGYTINTVLYPQVFDLTLIYGSGNEPTSVEEFRNLFPLDYYPYNSGSLIPFMGNGIKTVGFNQWDEEWEAGTLNSDGSTSSASNRIITSYVPVLPNITYSMTIPYNGKGRGAFYDADKNLIEYFYDFPVSGRNDVFPRDGLISSDGNNYYFSFIPPVGTAFVRYNTISAYGTTYENNICINISDSSKNGTYEPYTSSTLSLPIFTYFPTGMKSAGNVYDELTESKAISRVGSVDLGTLTWNHVNSGGSNGYWQAGTGSIPNAKYISNYSGINIKGINPVDGSVIQSVGVYQMDGATVSKIGISQNGSANYQNASATVAPTGILYYELATPTETPITTASLVTENAEIPLSNNDGVLIGKCTEQLSSESGFFDAKIKLSDADGECYSNKIQLHVERSPQ